MGPFNGTVIDNIMVATRNTEQKERVAFSLSSLLHNQGLRSLFAALPTDSEHTKDELEAPWDILRSHRFCPALHFTGRSWSPKRFWTGPQPHSGPGPLVLPPHRSPSRSFLNWVPMRQARSGPTRPLRSRGSATPPIQMSMLLGVPYSSISFLARPRFFSTVPSSPTVLGWGSPQKRLQALYPAWR